MQAANQGNMEEFVKALQNAKIDTGEPNKQPEKRKTTDNDNTDAKKKDNKNDQSENWFFYFVFLLLRLCEVLLFESVLFLEMERAFQK